jgi:hypothetical protein
MSIDQAEWGEYSPIVHSLLVVQEGSEYLRHCNRPYSLSSIGNGEPDTVIPVNYGLTKISNSCPRDRAAASRAEVCGLPLRKSGILQDLLGISPALSIDREDKENVKNFSRVQNRVWADVTLHISSFIRFARNWRSAESIQTVGTRESIILAHLPILGASPQSSRHSAYPLCPLGNRHHTRRNHRGPEMAHLAQAVH